MAHRRSTDRSANLSSATVLARSQESQAHTLARSHTIGLSSPYTASKREHRTQAHAEREASAKQWDVPGEKYTIKNRSPTSRLRRSALGRLSVSVRVYACMRVGVGVCCGCDAGRCATVAAKLVARWLLCCVVFVCSLWKKREREKRERNVPFSLCCACWAVRCHTLTFGVLRCTLQDCSPPRSPLAQAQQRCVHHSRNRVTSIPRCGNSNVADSPSPAPLNHPKRPTERRQTTTWRQQNTPELTIFSPAHPVLIFLADVCCLTVFSKKKPDLRVY
jgi:hypothetical protein